MRRLTVLRVVLGTAIILALALSASAQYGASIQGTVTDQSGAIVKGAKVTVTNQATGVSVTSVTSDTGFYRVAGLIPGAYTVTMEAPSFKTNTVKNVQVAAESLRGVNASLQAGSVQEAVTVSGEAPPLQTETGNIAGTFGATQIQGLPQVGRDPYELLRLAPGIFGDGSRSSTGSIFLPNGDSGPGASNNSIYQVENRPQISANGQRVTANNYTLDGVDVNSLTWGGAAVVTPNQESISEFTVLSSDYSAEDGRNSGAQVKVISKTGTNAIHGSGFFRYDEPGLNAFNNFGGWQGNPTTRAPTQRVNDKIRNFGGSIGGPVVKDKLFWFFSYEGERRFNSQVQNVYVDTPQFDQLVTADRPGSIAAQLLNAPGSAPRIIQLLTPSCNDINQGTVVGNCQVVPGGLDLGSPAAGAGPGNPYLSLGGNSSFIGGGLDGIPDVTLAQVLFPTHFSGNQYNGRVDYMRGKHQFSASTFITASRNTSPANPQSRPMGDVINNPWDPSATLLWNYTITPTLLNEARFNFSRFHFDEITSNPLVNWGIPESHIEGLFVGGLPNLSWGVNQGENTPGLIAQNTFAIRDTLSKVTGAHALKFGFELRKEQNNNNEVGFARPLYSTVRLWNWANDAPIFEQVAANPSTGSPDAAQRYFRTSYYGLFGQTDWKVRPNLTVNLGLRYEYYAPLSETQGLLTNLALGTGANPLTGAQLQVLSQLYHPDRNNFAPRLGFAWAPAMLHNKAVLRGGFGVYYDNIQEALFDPGRENPPFHALFDICCGTDGSPFANGQIIYALGSSNSPLSYPSNPLLGGGIDPATNLPIACCAQVYSTPTHVPNPYVYAFSLETQYELATNTIVTLGYQGSASHKLVRLVPMNVVFNDTLNANPIFQITPDVDANYHSLNLNFQRQFSKGLQINAKYRWAKSMDQNSNEGPGFHSNQTWPISNALNYGPSDYDVKHYFVASGVWELPMFRGRNDLLGRALGGWKMSGIFTYHTGFPWTPADFAQCINLSGTGFICPVRPVAYFGGAGNSGSNSTFLSPGGNFPNGGPTYFDITHSGPPGIGRNSFRGPHYQTVDMTFGKDTMVPFIKSEQAKLEFRANFFNIFNHTNLAPFQFADQSTNIQSQFFGMATQGLAGRVVEFQTRLSF